MTACGAYPCGYSKDPAERVSAGSFYMATAAHPSRTSGRLSTEIIKC
nr:MAG TPA: hypothetical protein [Caudoviricetes sp.]